MASSRKKHSTEIVDSTSQHEGDGEGYFAALVQNPKISAARRCMAAKWLLAHGLSQSAAIEGLKAIVKSRKTRPPTRDRAQRMLHSYERAQPENGVDDPNSEFNRGYAAELRGATPERRVKARRWLGTLPFTEEQQRILRDTKEADESD